MNPQYVKKPRRAANARRKRFNRGGNSMITLPRSPTSFLQPTDQTKVELLWNGTYNVSASGVFATQNFGVAGPGINIPKYWGQYFGIYKYAYIQKVTFQIEVANIGGRPMRIVLAESNTQDVTPTSYLELAQTPRARTRTVIPGGNHSVVNLQHSTTAKAIMGHELENDQQFWNTVAAGPGAPILPLLVIGFEPIIPASTIDYTYQVRIRYDIKFFTLNHL